jgi:hypothetical protein
MADDLLGLGKAADALSKPLQDFLTKLLGPAASEAGELLADRVRYLRWKNTLHILEQSKQELDKRKLTVQNIPLKTLFPILEGASLESDDENLQTKWSNLLVSAASGNSTHPSYPKILSELTSAEAKLLDYLYSQYLELELQEKKLNELTDKLKQVYRKVPIIDTSEKNKIESQIKEIRKTKYAISRNFFRNNIQKNIALTQEDLDIIILHFFRLKLCEHPETESQVDVVASASLSKYDSYQSIDNYGSEYSEYSEKYELDTNNESITTRISETDIIHFTLLGKMFMKACQAQSD